MYVYICVYMYYEFLYMNKLMSSKAMHLQGRRGGGTNITSSENEMDELLTLH